jgi:hypothetical protein
LRSETEPASVHVVATTSPNRPRPQAAKQASSRDASRNNVMLGMDPSDEKSEIQASPDDVQAVYSRRA